MSAVQPTRPGWRSRMAEKHGQAFVDAAVQVASTAPPLTPDQLRRLRGLFATASAVPDRSSA